MWQVWEVIECFVMAIEFFDAAAVFSAVPWDGGGRVANANTTD